MNGEQSIRLEQLLEGLRQGDEEAARQLVGHTYERLRFLARRILHLEFPRFDGRHATDSVLNAAVVRLLRSLPQVRPVDCRHYVNFAAVEIRRVLLDLSRRERPCDDIPELADSTHDPVELAVWTEIHEQVERLPDKEREVVNLLLYQGLTQEEAARIMGISQRMVSKHWASARLRLAAVVPDLVPLGRKRGMGHGQ
jgi:RNA polymerase sigma-70 factor (ECF subfamily)